MNLNLSNYSLTAFEGGVSSNEISAIKLIQDFVLEIDKKIVMALFLFGIMYYLSLIILPRAYKGMTIIGAFINIPVFDVIIEYTQKLIKFLISLSETFCLGCGVFVLYIAYVQGLLLSYQLYIIFGLVGLSILILLSKLYTYIVNKKYQETIKKLDSVMGDKHDG